MSGGALREVPYEDDRRSEIVAFIERATEGHIYWADVVLAQLIAGPEAVCDLWRGEDRVGVAVSLDDFEAEGNAAEVSVFTAVPGDEAVIEALLDWGEARGATAGRANVDVPIWPGAGPSEELLVRRGYRLAHVMYDMERPADAGAPRPPGASLPEGWRWQEPSDRYLPAFHETALRAFEGIPSAFVSAELEEFARRQKAAEPPPLVLCSGDPDTPVAGFLRVEIAADGAGVLGLLARHPRYRGLGLGEHLVYRGLSWLRDLGSSVARLEVAATNRAGLTLYESYGFRVAAERAVYRRPIENASDR